MLSNNSFLLFFIFSFVATISYGQEYVVVKLQYFNDYPPYFRGNYRLLGNLQLNEEGESVFIKSLEKQTLYDRHFNEIRGNSLKVLKINPNEIETLIGLDPALVLKVKFSPKKIKATPKYLMFKDPTISILESIDPEFVIKVTSKDISKYLKLYVEPNGYKNVKMKKIIKKMLFSFQVIGYLEKDSVVVRDAQLEKYNFSGRIPNEDMKKFPEIRKITELQNKILSRIDSLWKPKIQEKYIVSIIRFMEIYDDVVECYMQSNPLEQNKIIVPFYDKLMVLIKERKIPLYHPDSIGSPFSYERAYEYLASDEFKGKAWRAIINKLHKDYSFYFMVHYKWKRKKDKITLTPTAITFTLYDGIMPDQNLFTILLKDLKKLDFPYKEFISILSDTEKIAMYPVQINDYTARTCEEVKHYYKELFNKR